MKKPKPPDPRCNLCHGRGWFMTSSDWPTECHRCYPEVAIAKRKPPVLPQPVAAKLPSVVVKASDTEPEEEQSNEP